jgi:hypothetical protein
MKKILSLFIVIALSFSCTNLEDKFYDRLPADMFPENEEQLGIMTIPVYTPLGELLDWGGWWFCQEITTDEIVIPTRDTDWDDGGKWRVLHQHDWNNTTEAIASMWSRFYKGVFETNKLIELWEPGAGTPSVDLALAKLKTMRALYYYLLIDNYGNVPYVTQFAGAPEFPLKMRRDSIWQYMVDDVKPMIRHFTDGGSKYTASKGMAYMLMAKLYLNAEVYTGTPQWEIAEKYCDSVISMGYSLESNPLGPFVTNNQNSPEIIFAIPFDEDAYTGFNLHMRTLHYNSNLTFNMPVGPWNGMAVVEDHFDTYAANDKRKAGFLIGQQYTSAGAPIMDAGAGGAPLIFNKNIPALQMNSSHTKIQIRMSGARVVKFEIKLGAKDNLSNDFPIFRYADALLMKAEALLRQGKTGEAVSYVNEVRARAFETYTPLTSITLDELLAERGREMFYEAHRRQDLIRFGKFNTTWWEKTNTDPARKTFPIPQWAIDSNPNLGL